MVRFDACPCVTSARHCYLGTTNASARDTEFLEWTTFSTIASRQKCSICGGTNFSGQKVIWPELAAQWQLSDVEVSYVDKQQGCACDSCGANLRIVALGDAVRRAFGTRLPLQAFVATPEAAKLRVLDINGAMAISSTLAKLPLYVRGDFPAVICMHCRSATEPLTSWFIPTRSNTWDRPVRALEECAQVLAADGCLCFTIPIIVGRLTRNRAGLAKSYHGDPSVCPRTFSSTRNLGRTHGVS